MAMFHADHQLKECRSVNVGAFDLKCRLNLRMRRRGPPPTAWDEALWEWAQEEGGDWMQKIIGDWDDERDGAGRVADAYMLRRGVATRSPRGRGRYSWKQRRGTE